MRRWGQLEKRRERRINTYTTATNPQRRFFHFQCFYTHIKIYTRKFAPKKATKRRTHALFLSLHNMYTLFSQFKDICFIIIALVCMYVRIYVEKTSLLLRAREKYTTLRFFYVCKEARNTFISHYYYPVYEIYIHKKKLNKKILYSRS